MKLKKRWRLREEISPSADEALKAFPKLIRPLLHARGFVNETMARLFLEPDYDRDLHNPFLMQDMARAVARIQRALEAGEKIIIFGDYDADGIPAAVILASFFNHVGYSNYEVYIPDRHEEAYGLNAEAITGFARGGATLIITVDCGVSNQPEIVLANSLGLEVIVTDHHAVPEVLPLAYAIVNPKRLDDQYPYKMLCGAGVAFKLVQALAQSQNSRVFTRLLAGSDADENFAIGPVKDGWEKWLLDLVAIATVADMVPLTGENRALTHFGLIVLRQSPRPGIVALCRAFKLNQAQLTIDDIAFSIGPRLNSASRMAHGLQAYRLLATADPVEAASVAATLEDNNRARRGLVATVLAQAEAMIDHSPDQIVIVCGDPSWSLGVLGLAASRLVERYQRPVFLWSKNGRGEIKGSCRASGTVNVVGLMRSAGHNDFFNNFGGHTSAGGFSLTASRVGDLAERLAIAYRQLNIAKVEEELLLDAELSLVLANAKTASLLDQLGPFGLENPKPIFLFRNIPLVVARSFGTDRAHLEITLGDGQVSRRAIGFFMSPDRFGQTLQSGQPIDLAATLEQSYFRGCPELRLRIVDLRMAE
ncbi:MAG TPA: single-stranded-DNA-specific exonuclease RecJ [Candidatus Paceibacterota bacterium]